MQISRDEAYAIFTMTEGRKWAVLGCSAKPAAQMSRQIKKAGYGSGLRRGQIYWFGDKVIARRIFADTKRRLDATDCKRAGNAQRPKYNVPRATIEQALMASCQAAAPNRGAGLLINQKDILSARHMQNIKTMKRVGL